MASLEVPDLYTMQNRKFDNRIYVLVPSVEPLIVLFHQGHLRFSALNYTSPNYTAVEYTSGASEAQEAGSVGGSGKGAGGREATRARHITNPNFGLAYTNNTADLIRPVQELRRALGAKFVRFESSVRNAALMVVLAFRLQRQWGGGDPRWGYLFLSMDVAVDLHQNAMVLDVNSGPSFYHGHAWPPWFVRERSALIRQAADIIQEVAFRKLMSPQPQYPPATLDRIATTHRAPRAGAGAGAHDRLEEPLVTAGAWEAIYSENSKGTPLAPPQGMLPHGACVLKH
jgi:hypothetical protein